MIITFLHDFDYRVDQHLTIAYKAGMEIDVDDDCVMAAFEAGACELPDFDDDDDDSAEADA